MQLSIAPKVVARNRTTPQSAFEAESSVSRSDKKENPSPLYAVAIVVRIGILGTVLFHALTFWP